MPVDKTEDIILLIEDNIGLAELVCERLNDAGRSVVSVKSGREAREWLLHHHAQLILLDYSLPDVSGMEFVAQVSAMEGGMPPFIVATGVGDEKIAVAMMKSGARDYLVKDINFLDNLPVVVDHILREIVTEQRLEDSERALTQSEERYRILFENSSIAIWEEDLSEIKYHLDGLQSNGVVDFSSFFDAHPHELNHLASLIKIENINQTSVEMFGAESKAELLEKLPVFFNRKSMPFFKQELLALTRGDRNFYSEVPIHNLKDQPLVLMLYLNVLPGYERTLSKVLVSFVEITDRKRREDELQLMATVSAALRIATTRSEMFPIILDQASALVRTPHVCLMLLDAEKNECVVELARGIWTELQGKCLPVSQSACGRVLTSGQTFLSQDFHSDPILMETFPTLQPMALTGVPLAVNHHKIGVLWTGHLNDNGKQQVFTSSDIQLLGVIADIGANAINRIRSYEEAQRVAADLALAYDRTLEGWARALELRDQETEGHARRVATITVELAQIMGLRSEEMEPIRWGALLHDIGKMGIPDNVLLKPGPLTESEWEIMRRHPEYAVDMLKPIEHLRKALDIPYCHHEKWNGSGYPRGLKGEEIPLAARIFAIVDVWDALTNARPYGTVWSTERALKYIQEQNGVQFDPQVVQAFWALMEQHGNIELPK
jgi:putative nucleotidyltransferase with HDIG domain